MADNAEKTWKDELMGNITKEDYKKREDEFEDRKLYGDPEFRNAVNDGTLFKTDGSPAEKPAESPQPDGVKKESSDPWWKVEGYASEDEAREKFKNLRSLVDKKQQQIDTFNAERGSLTQKSNAELNAEREKAKKLEEELKKAKETSVQNRSVVEAPTMPIPPVLGDEEDPTSARYVAEQRRYADDIKKFNDEQQAYSKRIQDQSNELLNIKKNVADQSSYINQDKQYKQEQRQLTAKERAEREWHDTIEEVDKFAKDVPQLKMSKGFEEINNAVASKGYEEASKIYPETDMKSYETLVGMVKDYRHFDDKGGLKVDSGKKQESLMDVYLINLRKTGRLTDYMGALKKEGYDKGVGDVVDKIGEHTGGAVDMPSGGEEKDPQKQMSQEQKDLRLSELAGMDDAKLESDPVALKEYINLCDEKGMANAIPVRWREKFDKKT